MKKNKKKLITSLVILIILSIGIGYAYLTSNLSITGATEIAANTWDIHFANLVVNSDSVEATTPAAINPSDNTSITYTVKLNRPKDFYEFTVDVVNGGTINAKIADNGVTNTSLTQTQDTYVNYTVTYADGTEISAGDKLAKAGTTVNSVAQNVKTVKVRVEYDPTITPAQLNAMGENYITLDLTFAMTYVQD